MVRALRGLGDMLTAVPAWRALRAALPETTVTLIGLSETRWVLERFSHYIDELVEFPSFPGIPELPLDVAAIPPFLARVQAQPFDLAIQMHGSGTISNIFTAALGARSNAGFYLPGQYCPDPLRFLPYPSSEPEVRRHLRLMEFLGWAAQGDELEFPVLAEDRRALKALSADTGLAADRYVCIHPGAQDPARRWAPEHFATVGDRLAELGHQIVLTGTAGEASVTRAVAQAMHFRALDLAGCTPLGTLAALLEGARLLVCNDTGVSHLAAALGTPSVVIFLASDPARWAPANQKRHRRVGWPLADTEFTPDGAIVAVPGAPNHSSFAALPVRARSGMPIATPRRVLAEAEQLLDGLMSDAHAA